MSDTLWLVLLFLLLTLIVGVVAGGSIKNLREYAVAGTEMFSARAAVYHAGLRDRREP